MLLPTKHVDLSQSIIGFGAYIIKSIGDKEVTIEKIWDSYVHDFSEKENLPTYSYNNLVLTITFLYSIDAIIYDEGGYIKCA